MKQAINEIHNKKLLIEVSSETVGNIEITTILGYDEKTQTWYLLNEIIEEIENKMEK